jgi:hypothetical protein
VGPCCGQFRISVSLGAGGFLPSDRKSFAPAELPSSTPSPTPLFPSCINLNWLQSHPQSLLSTAAMFSRAIRQSSRRVAAISASGRIASVSPSHPPQTAPAAVAAIVRSSQTPCPMPLARHWSFVDGFGAAAAVRWLQSSCEELPLPRASTDSFAPTRPAHPPSAPSEATPPMRRPPPPRCPLSWSRGSAAYRRRTASPRPDVCSPSGMPRQRAVERIRS